MKCVIVVGLFVIGLQVIGQELSEIVYGKMDEVNFWDLCCFFSLIIDLLIIKFFKEIKSVDFFDFNGCEIKVFEMLNYCYFFGEFLQGWLFVFVESMDGFVEKKNVFK